MSIKILEALWWKEVTVSEGSSVKVGGHRVFKIKRC